MLQLICGPSLFRQLHGEVAVTSAAWSASLPRCSLANAANLRSPVANTGAGIRNKRMLSPQQVVQENPTSYFIASWSVQHTDLWHTLVQVVATRACYLFSRLVKILRQNLRPFVREVLHSIQGHLVHIATHPPPEAGPPTSKAGAVGGAKITTTGAFLATTDDRWVLYMSQQYPGKYSGSSGAPHT